MTQNLPRWRPLGLGTKAELDSATPTALAAILAWAVQVGDVETCTYITARHFEKLPADTQKILREDGLKAISDITQALIDGVLSPAANSVH